MTRPPLKLIEWEDAFNGTHDWTDLCDIAPDHVPMLVTTTGFEVRRNKTVVTLAMSYCEARDEPTCCDLFTIPLAMIRKERTLK